MRLATTILGTAMGTIAILYILWVYSIGTFVATASTDVDLAADISTITYLVLAAAMLQILAAGLAHDLPWGAFVTAILAMAGYFIVALDGPEVFIAWAGSAVVMVGCIFFDMTMEIFGSRQQPESGDQASPVWELDEEE